MGGEIRNSVHEPPAVLANPFQIRCIVVASLQIFLQAQVVLPLAIGQIFGHREKFVDELLHLAIRQLDGGQLMDALAKLTHVTVGKL